jgi:cobalt-zinc-cadmium efflux system protein
MLFTPKDIVINDIVNHANKIEGIKNIHHIHIWQLNENEVHLEAHIDLLNDISISEFDGLLEELESVFTKDFGINHINIQPEYEKPDSKDIIVQD